MPQVSSSKFVNIIPQVLVATGSGFELNGLLLTKNDNLPLGVPYKFASQSAVASYLGSTSAEAAFATAYFTSFSNKTKIPPAMLIANYSLDVKAGWLRGAAITSTLAQFKTITNGNLKFYLNDGLVEITALDFSAATSMSDIATAIQTKIRALNVAPYAANATCTYSSLFNAFQITSGATDSTGTVSFAVATATSGTDLSAILLMRESDGAVVSKLQSSAITEAQYMNNIVLQTQNFISFTRLWAVEDTDEDLAFSAWVASKGVRYVYFEWDKNSVDILSNNATDFASVLKAAGYAGIVPNYGDQLLCAFVMGMICSIDFTVKDGRITCAFKTQAGQTVTCDNDDNFDVLTAKGYNFYCKDGTANNQFYGYQHGTISGDYEYIDSYVNQVWLNDQMQVALRELQQDSNSLPYNNNNYGFIQSTLKSIIDTAINAGVINVGIDPSAEQIAAVKAETGLDDVETPLYTFGWLLYIASPSATIRAQRGSPIIRFYYMDGGSIQQITLYSTAIR